MSAHFVNDEGDTVIIVKEGDETYEAIDLVESKAFKRDPITPYKPQFTEVEKQRLILDLAKEGRSRKLHGAFLCQWISGKGFTLSDVYTHLGYVPPDSLRKRKTKLGT